MVHVVSPLAHVFRIKQRDSEVSKMDKNGIKIGLFLITALSYITLTTCEVTEVCKTYHYYEITDDVMLNQSN